MIKNNPEKESWRNVDLGPCACSQLRRAARAVSSMYDEFLASVGLTVTQYALLVNIGRAEQISRTALAAKMGMERTTLTRNLRPLERQRLFSEKPGEDRRERALQLTAAGRRRLARSYPRWRQAQKTFASRLGAERMEELRSLLAIAAKASCDSLPSART